MAAAGSPKATQWDVLTSAGAHRGIENAIRITTIDGPANV